MSVLIYRTRDGLADYKFSFERQPDGDWRIYILNQPSYGPRSTDGHPTHRYSEGARRFVCWDRPLRTEGDAHKVAATWANRTQRYIRFAEPF